ncbi:MAG: hypothetical protein JW780_03710 [Clostridiales bacterium]|nr:hypothetical protein [Clostridiales bacterium]
MGRFAVNERDSIEALYSSKNAVPRGDGRRNASFAHATKDSGARKLKPVYDPAPSDEKRKRKEAEEQRLRRAEILQKYKLKEKSVSRKRFKESLVVILGVAIVTGMFASVLFRQAQIASLNFQNNATEKRINAIKQETAQIRENMILGTDLEKIHLEATERLGMQEPGINQIVSVRIGRGDKLLTRNTYNSIEVSPVALAQAKEDLAEYFSDES